MRRSWWLGTTGLLALVACTGTETTPSPDVPPPDGDGDNTVDASTPDTPAPAPLTPRVQEVGPAGVAPAQVVVHVGRSFFDGVQTLAGGNVLELSPAVKGRLERVDDETIAFTPDSGFAPGTTYTATLKSIENGDGVTEGSWSRTFTTPDFALARAALHSRDLETGLTDLDLVFSAPVDPGTVRTKASFSLDGKAISPIVIPGDQPNEVRFRFTATPKDDNSAVLVSLSGGVPWLGDAGVTAKAESRSVALKLGPPVEILATQLKEGLSGFYLDVICRDEAVESERYFWDEDTWDGWWVTSRCMLSAEEVAAMVRTSPAVDLTVAPAGAGFRLFGDFPQGDYTLEVDAGARTVDGGVLPKAHSHRFRVGARAAQVRFASKGRYLPRESWDQLAVRHLNVDEAELTVRHVPAQNLVFWMSGDSEGATERTADTVLKETIALEDVRDSEVTTWLDIGRLLPEAGRGVYELTLEAGGASDTARMMLTDLQIVAKRAPAQDGVTPIWAWALDAHNGSPVQGVDLSVILPSGRVVADCTTPLDGGCLLTLEDDPIDDADPMAIIAERGKDMSYLKFSELELSPESDVSGLPYGGAAAYHAALMTERGVYRPGETVHLSMIARGEDHVAPESPLPVVLKVYDARGRELRRLSRTTNAVGVLTEDIGLSDFAVTGRYRVEAAAGDAVLGEVTFNVEEFVPERMAAEVTVLGEGVRPTDAASVEVSARWLFGGDAADSRVELTCSAESAPFVPPQNAAYHYGPAALGDTAPRPVVLGIIEGLLGDGGVAGLSCPPASTGGGSMAGRLVARAAVFEGDSGRSTVETATAPLHPENFYLGLRANVDTLGAGEQATIDGVVVDWDGAVTNTARELTVEIFRLEEEIGWVWDENTGSSIRRSQLRHVREDERTLPIQDGRFAMPFTPPADAAGYLLVARSGDATTELHIPGEGRRYWWDPGERYADQTPRPERPAPLELRLPPELRVGEAVTVSTTVPYDGRILWAVETDGVIENRWESVRAGEAEWSFTVDDFEPNVYVSALLVKDPHLESRDAYLPARAFGVASVRVRPEAYLHTTKVIAPEEVAPNSPLTVILKVENTDGPTYATVAAVDEGILQLTDFDSPDPQLQIFAQRALGVETFETVGWSLANSGGPGSRTGGDEGGPGGGRVQMVKPVSLWSGLVEVKDGRAEVRLDVPSYRGALRVMAVTADAGHIGADDATVLVRDPLVLQTTLPRFLTEADTAEVPVFVSNMTGKDGDITVSLGTEELALGDESDSLIAPVSIEGPASQSIRLAAGESGSVVFKVRAGRAPAAARFTVTASGNGTTSTDTLDVPIEPSQPQVRRAAHVSVAAGQQVDIDAMLSGWLPGSDRSTVWLSANPYGGAFSHLQYLIRYPYGCIEQTTSSTRPLLYVSSLLENIEPGLTDGGDIDEMVRYGIERVASMQTPSGGFAYWPGGSHPSLWPTAYATHMLLDARDQGRSLPDGLLENAVEWMAGSVENTSDLRGAAYAHYILARAGEARTADAQRRLESTPADREESRTLLMAAIQQAGVRTHEATLKRPDLTPVSDKRDNDWSFYSDRRRRALTLNVLEELFPGDAANEALAALVSDAIDDRESSWYTTQELAWAISGLGKRVVGMNASLPDATLLADQKALAARQQGAQGTTWRLWSASRYSELSLAIPPSDKPLYLHVTTDGVRSNEPAPLGGEGLALTREYLNADGQALDPATHNLGDLFYVKVTIQNTHDAPVQNIAMVDRIPAGWEIENPRLGRGSLPEWAEDLAMWDVEHMNLRDNRLEVFGKLDDSRERVVVYAARAVTAGRFKQPDVSAEAMYEPRIWARQPGSEIEIVGPWAAAL